MWNLKYGKTELIYKTDSHRQQTGGCQGGGGGGGKAWEFGISTCKLLHIGWINNQVLLCSTGSYIHYPGINQNGNEYEKEYMYN